MSAASASDGPAPASAACAAASGAPPVVASGSASSGELAGGAPREALRESILRLKAEQATMKSEKKRVSSALKRAQRRASKLKKRARQLTDSDLLEVLRLRGEPPHAPHGVSGVPGPASSEANAGDGPEAR